MNFKDAYKSYNDEITGNREILASILSGESKRKKVFNYRPLFAGAALAIFAVAVCAVGFPWHDSGEIGNPPLYVASDDREFVSDIPSGNDTVSKTDSMVKSESATNAPAASASSDETGHTNQMPQNKNKSSQSEAAGNNVQPTSSGNRDSGKADSEPTAEVDNNNVAESEKSRRVSNASAATSDASGSSSVTGSDDAGESDIAVASISEPTGAYGNQAYDEIDWYYDYVSGMYFPRLASPPEHTQGLLSGGEYDESAEEYVLPSDYYAYLGVDIEEKAALPDGMYFYGSPDIAMKKSGDEVIYDSIYLQVVSDSDSGRKMSIHASKSNSFATNSEAEFEGDDSSNRVVVNIKGVSFDINSDGIGIDEVRTLVESLR